MGETLIDSRLILNRTRLSAVQCFCLMLPKHDLPIHVLYSIERGIIGTNMTVRISADIRKLLTSSLHRIVW